MVCTSCFHDELMYGVPDDGMGRVNNDVVSEETILVAVASPLDDEAGWLVMNSFPSVLVNCKELDDEDV